MTAPMGMDVKCETLDLLTWQALDNMRGKGQILYLKLAARDFKTSPTILTVIFYICIPWSNLQATLNF